MANLFEAQQILRSNQTQSEVFNPPGRFQLVLLGNLTGGTQTWHLQIKPASLEDGTNDANWRNVTSSAFTNALSTITFDGSRGFDYRLNNSSTGTGIVAYWGLVSTHIYRGA